uniref:Uncharacterized protein n=1 Tax=uncultured Armatimonadetes bacterium TaxID=157466 RepID=A0A6J4IUE6_9BACT|nr:hypothetical protein AVDCRST_MAG63-3193 [uncultured Armatimonadetes bacterium]
MEDTRAEKAGKHGTVPRSELSCREYVWWGKRLAPAISKGPTR